MAEKRSISYRLGAVARILSMTHYRSIDLQSIVAHTMPAIRLNQILLLEDVEGNPTAFLTWAYLTDEISRTALSGGLPVLQLGDWNGGVHLWIIDIVVIDDNIRVLLRRFIQIASRGHKVVMGIRGEGSSRSIKRVRILSRSSFTSGDPDGSGLAKS
ncbi:toxin-activating lysine-acyltransferase [Sphingomonas qomolangmaensis]|uniref:RTX toxin-activating lysine-acyltransferase n=1 Tax=Sphingomonas qomolangmaensis TaxID=2918765 RepID=A0ABY5L704_9SPHN|nr:toxin-activating lysine-acyltransferase [Sphingomonas qomolangmaensis]UUL82572.1 toxin-activating lysine-acyltransferase [Sphingomonas qomolangmaensis]